MTIHEAIALGKLIADVERARLEAPMWARIGESAIAALKKQLDEPPEKILTR